MAKFAGAYADINYAAERAKNPPWWKFGGSAEEEAMNAFTAQKKIQQMRQEVETMIGYAYGQDGLEEYKETLRKVRKQRQDTAYRKEESMESLIAWFVANPGFVVAGLTKNGFIRFAHCIPWRHTTLQRPRSQFPLKFWATHHD